MAAAFGAALLLAAAVLLAIGDTPRGIGVALALTARLAFLFFWPAYAGSALVALFGPGFRPVQVRGRELGLAFAAVLAVHLGLVAWLSLGGSPPGAATFFLFGIAAVWSYVIALLSIGRLRGALSERSWWLLRTAGMNYIAYAFFIDFFHDPRGGGVRRLALYLPFAALAIAGPALRLAPWGRRAARLAISRVAPSRL